MPTGIEEVGLVLATWPIVIGALKFYAEEQGVIKDFRKFQRTLKDHHDDVDTAFETFCEIEKHFRTFIADHSGMSLEDVDLMMRCPDNERWQREWDLRSVIDSDTAKRFARICVALELVLGQIHKILGSIDKTQSSKRQWMKLIIVIRKDELKALIKRIRDYNQDLFVLFGLKTMSIAANTSQPSRKSTKFYEKIRQHIDDLDSMLCHRFVASSSCRCSSPHHANLKLEYRRPQRTGTNIKFEVVFAVDSNFGSVSSIPLPWKWRETELEAYNADQFDTKEPVQAHPASFVSQATSSNQPSAPPPQLPTPILQISSASGDTSISKRRSILSLSRLKLKIKASSEKSAKKTKVDFTLSPAITLEPINEEEIPTQAPSVPAKPRVAFQMTPVSVPTRPKLQEISDLCSTLSHSDFGTSWSGVLTHEEKRCQRIRAVMRLGLPADSEIKTVSLASLLLDHTADLKQQKWTLGLQLASSVLQLHTTSWLNERWGAKDILFFRHSNGNVFYDKPFIRRTFTSNQCTIQSSASTSRQYRSIPVLFALGIVLLELYYRQPFESLQNEDEKQNRIKLDPVLGDTIVAERLLQEMEETDLSSNYIAVIRRCIYGVDTAYTSLKEADLRDAVEENVIMPLERDWKFYSGTA